MRLEIQTLHVTQGNSNYVTVFARRNREEDPQPTHEYNIDFSSTAGEHTTNGKEDETSSPEAADAGATEYQDDPAAEVFGTAGDQVKDISLPKMTNILIDPNAI